MSTSSLLVYLDDYHLGDVLFLQGLTRAYGAARGQAPPSLLVHGSGEEAERLLEAEGLFVERKDGILPAESPAAAALVERAVRQVNRRLVGMLTDAVVPAVGLLGTDRAVLRVDAEGHVNTGKTGWVRALLSQRVLPVVGAYAQQAPESGREVDAVSALLALAVAVFDEAPTVVFFTRTNLPGLMDGRETRPEATLDALDPRVVGDLDALRRVAGAGLPILLTNTARVVGPGGPVGTRIVS